MGMRGRLKVFALRPGRAPLLMLEKFNLIVDIGLSVPSRMLGGNAGSPLVGGSGFSSLDDIAIGAMKLGNHPSPTPPGNGTTVGIQQLAYTPVMSVSYPDDFSVTFEGVIPADDGSGLTITEEALFLRNGLLFSRVLTSVPKIDGIPLAFQHTIFLSRDD